MVQLKVSADFKTFPAQNKASNPVKPFEDIAEGMEANFTSHMLAEMRKTIPKEGPDSSAMEYYNSLLDFERAQLMAKSDSGLGVKKVIIHSNKKQEFHIIEYNGEFNEGTSKWYCSDLNGRTCNLFITKINTETGVFTVGIEYSDLIYYYVCKFE